MKSTSFKKNHIVAILLSVIFFISLFACSFIIWKHSCNHEDAHNVYISTIMNNTVYYLNLDTEHPAAIISKKRPENLQLLPNSEKNAFQIRFVDDRVWQNRTLYLCTNSIDNGLIWGEAIAYATDFVFSQQKNSTVSPMSTYKIFASSRSLDYLLKDEIVLVSTWTFDGTARNNILSLNGNGYTNIKHVEWFIEKRFK